MNEVRRVTFSAAPKSGTFALTFDGDSTSAIGWNADGAAITAELESLPSIGSGNVSATRVSETVIDVEFIGALADTDISAALTCDTSALWFPLYPELVYFGRMNGDGVDYSGWGNDLESGSASFTASDGGKVDEALSLDADGMLYRAAAFTLAADESFRVFAWLYPAAGSGDQGALATWQGGGDSDFSLGYFPGAGQYVATFAATGGYVPVPSEATIVDEAWNFLTTYFDGTNNKWGVSVNLGTPAEDDAENPGATGTLQVGGGGDLTQQWKGLIDCVGFVIGDDTDPEVAVYNSGTGAEPAFRANPDADIDTIQEGSGEEEEEYPVLRRRCTPTELVPVAELTW